MPGQGGIRILEYHLDLGPHLVQLFFLKLEEINICLIGKVIDDFS